ncbi:hypothetical protein [Methylobacterium nodulans]|uniref:Uncharacterized protein n=1 Tax=Methylobacterium nodulans (strain LMG 21967 / CNCM I-2342 / ORS 2060) TaxID=460265 RepID=B8IFK9_METNO|nr:hypothetical protein [Methylobacterium nodulans]ACL57744.1 conserved hypothetical protein [Methylobacterium nodulans ORS 2060]
MPNPSTVADLCNADLVTRAQVDAAIAAFLSDPTPGPHRIAEGVTIDIAAAVQEHPWAHMVAYDAEVSRTARHLAVRTAVLLAILG